MATYLELRNLMDDGELKARTETALLNTARRLALIAETPVGDRQLINKVFSDPEQYAKRVVRWFVLTHQALTPQAIQDLPDADIQTAANEVAAHLKAAHVPEVAASAVA
jgi:hypothetical protein